MRTRLGILGAGALVAAAVAVPLLPSNTAQAAGFTGGDLVVYRVGTGTAPLTNAATAVFLDTYGPTPGAAKGSVALPTTASNGNQPLTAAGQSRSEGLISTSPDGKYVALTGYAAAPGATGTGGASLTTTDPGTTSRVVGLLDAHGVVDTSTTLAGDLAPQIIRSAVTTDGDQVLAAGGDGGILRGQVASSATSVVAGDASSNLNALSISGSTLFTSGIVEHRLATLGTGSLTDVPGLPDNLLTYGYAALDLTSASYAGTGVDTLYLADASNRGGTVDKYRFDGSTWTKAGDVDVDGVTGLVADQDGAAVSLAVTTPTQLLTLTDPAGSGTTFAATGPTVLATAATNTEFRGVALAPAGNDAPSAFFRTPARGSSVDISAAGIPVSAYVKDATAVTVSVGGNTAPAAKGSGDVWTASVPTSGLAAGSSTVQVKATNADGTTTISRPVTLSGTAQNVLLAGSYGADNKLVKRSGKWSTFATTLSPSGKGVTSSKKKSALTTQATGKKLTLTFVTGPKAGKAAVKVDGKTVTVDLYAKKAGSVAKTVTLGGTSAHTVAVTVTGTKAAKSKGITVALARLVVA